MTQARKTALITGGTGALGVAVVDRFLADDWRVVVPWIVATEREAMRSHPLLELVEADLFDAASAEACVEAAAGAPDAPLTAVVNLVGGYAAGGRVHETPVEDFEAQLRLNLRPTYLVSAAAVPHLSAAGGGAITCVSSRAALRPFPGAAGYVTAKLAVLGLVDSLAVEYLAEGVRVNAVLPSIIDTPGNRSGQPDADHGRWVAPAQIAETILFLSSDGAAAISGAHVPVYGGA
jgi:NAD(P)-dependent dehydrogenase (short-subunit alcohol dehydrogenase family)